MTAAEIKQLRTDFARSGGLGRARKLSKATRIKIARKAGIASGKARAKSLRKKQQTNKQTKQTNRAA